MPQRRDNTDAGQQSRDILQFLVEKTSRKDFRAGVGKDLYLNLPRFVSACLRVRVRVCVRVHVCVRVCACVCCVLCVRVYVCL